MSGRGADRRASARTFRRRRLGAMVGAGWVIVLLALAVDAVADGDGPAGVASAGGPATTTTTVPPWVWAGKPSAPVPVQAAGGVAPVITRVETADPVVFLTIDDGIVRSPEALAAFQALGIPASLFLMDGPIRQEGGWFGQLPRTLVESHSQTHPDFHDLGEEAQRAEICGNADLIEQAYGRRPVLFRPPYGNYDAATQRAAAACGMRAIVLWQQSVNGDVIGFREAHRFRPGDIVLMHFRDSFVEELHLVRDRVQEAGLRFALLEDYLAPDSVPPS